MKLEIRSVADKGTTEKERLILKVRADIDVGDFVVMQTGWNGRSPTVLIHHTFWFPNIEVKNGDQIVLYTKKGTRNKKVMDDGRTAHFFYWGIPQPIWSAPERAAVVLYAPTWESKAATEL